jgi:hypothetical protein
MFAWSLVPLTALAAVAAAQAQDVGQIIDKNIAARGGLAAWHSVQTLTLEGTMEGGGKDNHALPFVMKMKRAHKSRLEITFNDQTSVQVYDGNQGWKVRPFLNRNEVEPFTTAETAAAAGTDELDGPLMDYAAKGTKIALVGKDTVEGKSAYKLKLTLKDGKQRNLWIDANSFLELKTDGEPRILDGKPHAVSVYYRDYKPEHGLMMPHVLETAVEATKAGSHKIEVAKVAVNEPLADDLFQKPRLSAATKTAAKQP